MGFEESYREHEGFNRKLRAFNERNKIIFTRYPLTTFIARDGVLENPAALREFGLCDMVIVSPSP